MQPECPALDPVKWKMKVFSLRSSCHFKQAALQQISYFSPSLVSKDKGKTFICDKLCSNFESIQTDTVIFLLSQCTYSESVFSLFFPLEWGCNMGKVSGSPGESIDLKASGLCRSSLLSSQCGFSSSLSVPEQSKTSSLAWKCGEEVKYKFLSQSAENFSWQCLNALPWHHY